MLSTVSFPSRLFQCDPGAWGLQRPTEATNRAEREEKEEVVGRKKEEEEDKPTPRRRKKDEKRREREERKEKRKREEKGNYINFVGTSRFRRLRSSLAPG